MLHRKLPAGYALVVRKIMRFPGGTSLREFRRREFVALNPPFRSFAKGWATHTRAAKRFFVQTAPRSILKLGCRTLASFARGRCLKLEAIISPAAPSAVF